MSKVEYIYVKAARMDRRVALAETNPDHPDGEAWVAGDERVHRVALTAEVAARLASKDIVRVAGPQVSEAVDVSADNTSGGDQSPPAGSGDAGTPAGSDKPAKKQ